MAKPGFLKFLAPIAAIGAGLAAPELLGALAPAEAGAGAGAAEAGVGAAEAGAAPGFLIPGTDVALAGAEPAASFSLAPALAGLGAEAGAAAPGLLAAGTEATPAITTPAVTAPSLAEAAAPTLTTGDVSGVATATPTSPLSAGSFGAALPPGVAQTSDLSLPGPQAGQAVNLFATEPASTAGTAGSSPSTITTLSPNLTADLPSADFTPQQLAAPGGAGPSAIGGAGSTIGDYAGKAGDYLLTHPGLPLTLGLFGSQLMKGQTPYPAETNVGNLAASQQGTAAALTAPLTTGVLPPGAQQEVSSAERAAEATTRSAFANMGLSGSTMEADAIAQAKQNAAAQQFEIAKSLLGSAAQFSGLSGEDYQTVLRTQAARDQNYQNALFNFARSLAGAGYNAPNYASTINA